MSSLVNNEPQAVKMRRNRGTLSVAGLGVMTFGLWSVVKFVMECLIGQIREDLVNTYSDTGTILAWIVIIVVVHLILTDVILRYIVGRCAWRESRGLRQGRWYLILAGNIAAGSILSIYLEAESIILKDDFSLYDYACLIVELTSLVMLIELFVASICSRRRKSGNAA